MVINQTRSSSAAELHPGIRFVDKFDFPSGFSVLFIFTTMNVYLFSNERKIGKNVSLTQFVIFTVAASNRARVLLFCGIH